MLLPRCLKKKLHFKAIIKVPLVLRLSVAISPSGIRRRLPTSWPVSNLVQLCSVKARNWHIGKALKENMVEVELLNRKSVCKKNWKSNKKSYWGGRRGNCSGRSYDSKADGGLFAP
ncbi:Hypothetical predicted protein [Podarcis lilfordi]|uniref:Uncharacterized protein n=1 Tax=Podarcis lilfordi TaxID=74358 RepID=A0AA35PNZ4_9SAUR|nr:Hypothetical predicted protein [Podarcis lilfordi]